MRPRVWLSEPVSSITKLQCCANFISCPFVNVIRFKSAMTVYKCLNRLAPVNFAHDCGPDSSVASRRHLRSADTQKLVLRRTRTVFGARDFPVSNAVVCALRVSFLTMATFADNEWLLVFLLEPAHLRTFLFCATFRDWWGLWS